MIIKHRYLPEVMRPVIDNPTFFGGLVSQLVRSFVPRLSRPFPFLLINRIVDTVQLHVVLNNSLHVIPSSKKQRMTDHDDDDDK